MCNIYQLAHKTVFRFQLYNLNFFQHSDCGIGGHYTFWWHLPSRRYVFCKHGSQQGGLTWFPEVNEEPRFPTPAEHEFLSSLVTSTMRNAYYYNGECSCGRGAFVNPKQEAASDRNQHGHGSEYFKRKLDQYYGYIGKHNCVFDEDYECQWDCFVEQHRKDDIAIGLLEVDKLVPAC